MRPRLRQGEVGEVGRLRAGADPLRGGVALDPRSEIAPADFSSVLNQGRHTESRKARSSGVMSALPASKSTVSGKTSAPSGSIAPPCADTTGPSSAAERVGHRGAAGAAACSRPATRSPTLLLPPLVAADEILELAPLAVRGPRQRRQTSSGSVASPSAITLASFAATTGSAGSSPASPRLRTVARTAARSSAGRAANSFAASSSSCPPDRQSIISIMSTKASSMNASATVSPITAPRRYWRVALRRIGHPCRHPSPPSLAARERPPAAGVQRARGGLRRRLGRRLAPAPAPPAPPRRRPRSPRRSRSSSRASCPSACATRAPSASISSATAPARASASSPIAAARASFASRASTAAVWAAANSPIARLISASDSRIAACAASADWLTLAPIACTDCAPAASSVRPSIAA